jgi:hypothetical protein
LILDARDGRWPADRLSSVEELLERHSAMMKRPTFASLLRETEAFLSALRQMGLEKSPKSKHPLLRNSKTLKDHFGFFKRTERFQHDERIVCSAATCFPATC